MLIDKYAILKTSEFTVIFRFGNIASFAAKILIRIDESNRYLNFNSVSVFHIKLNSTIEENKTHRFRV